jgi:N-acetylmuramoyl-L-alanine amidase
VSGVQPRLALAVLLLCVPFLMAVERPPGLGDVKEVRSWSYDAYTRVVLELNRNVDVPDDGLVRLPANPSAGRPDRLYVDVPGIWVGRKFAAGIPVGDGLLEAVRIGQNTLQNTRVVIDLERYDRHRLFTLASPPRIVIDVYGNRRPDSADPMGRLPASLRRVHTIVVDPGHGGRDPGAIGVGGIREKDVNLKIAKRLAERLRVHDFEVILTRDSDRTLDLEERTAIAESAGGDVFISIHANASRRAKARGIELYTLDANHQRHNLDVASRENGVPASKLNALQRALASLRADESASHSEQLAGYLHRNVIRAVKAQRRGIPDLGLKKGPFYVLFMSSMPSVLVETGFLTNKSDAALLTNSRFQQMLADELAEGVKHYRQQVEQGLVTASRSEPTGR